LCIKNPKAWSGPYPHLLAYAMPTAVSAKFPGAYQSPFRSAWKGHLHIAHSFWTCGEPSIDFFPLGQLRLPPKVEFQPTLPKSELDLVEDTLAPQKIVFQPFLIQEAHLALEYLMQ